MSRQSPGVKSTRGIDAALHNVFQLGRCFIDFRLPVNDGKVFLDAGRLDDDVFVHQGEAEVGSIDGPGYGVNGGHSGASFLPISAPIIAEDEA